MSKRNNLQRKKNIREPNPSYLIITEDSKSSPCYLKGLIRHLGLNDKRFEPCFVGSSPKSIQQKATVEIDNYEKIFCVFDKDTHDNKGNTYTDLLNWAKNYKKVHTINSVPCFEYWLLLHFEYNERPLENCDAVEKLLKNHLPNYHKGDVCFSDYEEGLENAIKRSKKSIKRFQQDDGEDPMTRMAEFYDTLLKIKK